MAGGRNGVSRWNVITKQRQLLWFDKILPPSAATAANASTCVDLSGARVEENPRIPRGITITPLKGCKYLFFWLARGPLRWWVAYVVISLI